ncbi:hypothetical protein T03_473 [Trichinella britovi]|uniref:Uncharacterized protein n=1 Tax=Trichinella britovi TaxID=45882 RepID=A0A0V1CEP6_TRIBR|nr:hypothetical protein T03_473 [Trichinella britovi]
MCVILQLFNFQLPAGSNPSSGSSGTYSVSLTSAVESPALATASRASSIVVSLTALLPSKLSSFTDVEDRVAVLVEAVRGFRNGEKAFTSRAEVFDSATVMRSHHSDDKQKDTRDPKRRGEVDIHWNWMHSELVGERYQQLNPSSTRHYTFASSSFSWPGSRSLKEATAQRPHQFLVHCYPILE